MDTFFTQNQTQLKGSLNMEDDAVSKMTTSESDDSFNGMDQETIQILVDDKIATGG